MDNCFRSLTLMQIFITLHVIDLMKLFNFFLITESIEKKQEDRDQQNGEREKPS